MLHYLLIEAGPAKAEILRGLDDASTGLPEGLDDKSSLDLLERLLERLAARCKWGVYLSDGRSELLGEL